MSERCEDLLALVRMQFEAVTRIVRVAETELATIRKDRDKLHMELANKDAMLAGLAAEREANAEPAGSDNMLRRELADAKTNWARAEDQLKVAQSSQRLAWSQTDEARADRDKFQEKLATAEAERDQLLATNAGLREEVQRVRIAAADARSRGDVLATAVEGLYGHINTNPHVTWVEALNTMDQALNAYRKAAT